MLPGAQKDEQIINSEWRKLQQGIERVVVKEVLHVPRDHGIIATYNRSSVLRYALASALWQTYQDFEVIVAGDCCTDDSEDVVRSFEDPRVRWLNLPTNSGNKSLPQNAGIEIARGRYIAYLAHDDLWHPNHLDTVVTGIEQSGADLVYSIAVSVPEPGQTRRHISGVFPEGHFRAGYVPITGGDFESPRLRGSLLPGGSADWLLLRYRTGLIVVSSSGTSRVRL